MCVCVFVLVFVLEFVCVSVCDMSAVRRSIAVPPGHVYAPPPGPRAQSAQSEFMATPARVLPAIQFIVVVEQANLRQDGYVGGYDPPAKQRRLTT